MKPLIPQLPERESRFLSAQIELRAAAEGEEPKKVFGYAAKFNSRSDNLGSEGYQFYEVIQPGAFDEVLNDDVRALFNHESSAILARSKNGKGSLQLGIDATGLWYEFEAPDTQVGRDLLTSLKRGDVDQMSFAFRVIRQKWNDDRSRRVLTEVSLADGDVSVVTYPAYPTTTVEAREHIKEAIAAMKEGREVTGESLIVVQAILDKIDESYEYLGEGKSMLETLLGVVPEMEEEAKREQVGDFVEWDSSGGTARGRIEHIMEEGVLGIPGTDFSITAEEDDPAVLVRVYDEFRDGWRPTETLVGHKMSELRYIDPLPEATEEEGRKISLRLARALINSTK